MLRAAVKVNEAITTLLLNYVALDLMLYLIYDRGRTPTGRASRPPGPLAGGRAAAAASAAAGCTPASSIAVDRHGGDLGRCSTYTSWGFRLRVVGGNAEAARRAGLPVSRLLMSAMAVGGALAGLGGMVHFAGAEFKLRPGHDATFGYIAFLASWLAATTGEGGRAPRSLLAVIAIGGDSLQIDSELPAAAVNVLMALVLLAVMGRAQGTAATPDEPHRT